MSLLALVIMPLRKFLLKSLVFEAGDLSEVLSEMGSRALA